jgi:hypothetical protein
VLNLKIRYRIWDTIERKYALKTRYTDENSAAKALERLRNKHPNTYGRFKMLMDATRIGRKRGQIGLSATYVGD